MHHFVAPCTKAVTKLVSCEKEVMTLARWQALKEGIACVIRHMYVFV